MMGARTSTYRLGFSNHTMILISLSLAILEEDLRLATSGDLVMTAGSTWWTRPMWPVSDKETCVVFPNIKSFSVLVELMWPGVLGF